MDNVIYTVQPRKHRHGANAAGMGLHCQEQSSTIISGVSGIRLRRVRD